MDDEPGKPGAVERTAVWVALKKSIEASRHLPLVHDPVIVAMVPPSPQLSAWQEAELERLKARAGPAGAGAGGSPVVTVPEEEHSDTQAFVTLALRCRYIDDELLSAIHALRRRLMLDACSKPSGSSGASVTSCRPAIQVVQLGSGLDTRPWRLPLGRDIRWFEVDLPDMVACCEGVAAGASGCSRLGSPTRFPLHVGSWTSLAADLSDPGWLAQLQGLGWQAEGLTVWVVEGVLYYLAQPDADRLIQEITGPCLARGLGALIVSTCTPPMIRAINSVKGGPQEDGSAAGATAVRWWWQANFPDYEATLGDDPCLTLRQAGWGAVHVVNTCQLESVYEAGRSTRILPAAAEHRAVDSCGGAPALYQIATATVGLGGGLA